MRMAWVDLKHKDGEAMDFTAMEKPIMRRSETILFFFSFFFFPPFPESLMNVSRVDISEGIPRVCTKYSVNRALISSRVSYQKYENQKLVKSLTQMPLLTG